MTIAKKHSEQLKRIKENVSNSYNSQRHNRDRFNEFRRFVFVTTLNDNDLSYLKTVQKPQLEFNTLEAYVSRLVGEFTKHDIGILAVGKDNVPADVQQINAIEGLIRNTFYEAEEQSMQRELFKDCLTGGFSCMKVYTDYEHDRSMQLKIVSRRVYDPTMIGFDPLAIEADKGDGEYFFELVPMRKEVFEQEHPEISTKDIKFKRALEDIDTSNNFGPFNWSYETKTEKVLLLCDYYEKKHKKGTLVELSTGEIMMKDEYNKFVDSWEAMGINEQIPAIVRERPTTVTTIERYKVIETEVLSHEKTELLSFPYVFIEGSGMMVKDNNSHGARYFTRPYVFNAIGAQKLKNFAGQSLANEIENMVMHKFIVAKDSIPPAYKDAYINVQQASVLVFNAFKNDNPDIPLPPPREVQRPPIPPELLQTFDMCDQLTQVILGNHDSSIAKMTERQSSGIAIQTAVSLSNSAAMPFVDNFISGIRSWAHKIVELGPLVHGNDKHSMAITNGRGKREYVDVGTGGVSMDYDPRNLDVKITAGASFNMEQEKALQYIKELMSISPEINEFVNTNGLDLLLDNIQMRGIDEFKERAEQFMQQKQEMMAQQMAQGGPPNIDQMKIDSANAKVAQDTEIAYAKLATEERKNRTETLLELAKIGVDKDQQRIEKAKLLAEMNLAGFDVALKLDESQQAKVRDYIETQFKAGEAEQARIDSEFARTTKEIAKDED